VSPILTMETLGTLLSLLGILNLRSLFLGMIIWPLPIMLLPLTLLELRGLSSRLSTRLIMAKIILEVLRDEVHKILVLSP
jgi:hypothetical protein